MSTVRCMVCGKESRTFDTFSNLTLPLPSNASRCTLQVCVLINGKVRQSQHSSQVTHQVIALCRDYLPRPRTSAEAKGTFLALCLLVSRSRLQTLPQRSAGDHMKSTLEPIGTSLLWNKKLIINWIDACQLQSFPSKKFFYLIPVCVHWFTSTSSFSQWNKLLIVYQRGFKQIIMTVSNAQRKNTPVVWHFVIIFQVPSRPSTGFQHLNLAGFDRNKPCGLMSAYKHVHYFFPVLNTEQFWQDI